MLKYFLLTSILLFTIHFHSQNENGEVFYSIKIKKNNRISQKFDSISLKNSKTKDGEAINKIMKSVKKSLSNLDDVEFKLLFNKHESYYAYEEKMDLDNSELSNMLKNIFIESGRKYSYNSKTKTVSKQTEFDGKKYIIKTHSDSLKWKLINVIKKIDGYTCYKATTILYKEYPSGIKEIPVIAWYSLDMKIPYGPGKYNGLPGLILELQEEDKILYANKISFSKTVKKIKKLKGEIITEDEFNRLWKKGLMYFGIENN